MLRELEVALPYQEGKGRERVAGRRDCKSRAGQRRPVCRVADHLAGKPLKNLKKVGRQGQF